MGQYEFPNPEWADVSQEGGRGRTLLVARHHFLVTNAPMRLIFFFFFTAAGGRAVSQGSPFPAEVRQSRTAVAQNAIFSLGAFSA